MKKIFTCFLALIAIVQYSSAQYFAYTASNASVITTNTYTDLGTNGTVISTNYLGQAIGTDDNSNVQNIGFSFDYSGQTFTQFTLNTNGFIKLGSDTVDRAVCRDVLASTSTTANNVIYPLNVNLLATGSTEYRVFTQGAAGSKTCTIQFKGIADSGCLNCGPSDPQFDYMEFQIVLHEGTNEIEFIYGNFTASANLAAFVSTNCGLKLNSASKSVNATKASATAFTSLQFIDGYYTGNHFNIRNAVAPTFGFTIKFTPVAVLQSNVTIKSLRYHGKVPKAYLNQASMVIQNIGKTVYPVYNINLNTTGANSSSTVQTINNFAPGDIDTVYFPYFNWANVGITYSEVSLPTDDDLSDNIDTFKQLVTTNVIGTKFDTVITNSIGTASSQIEMATLVKNSGTNKITTLTTYISGAGRQYRFYVYSAGTNAAGLDTPKSKIYSGTTLTSVAGKNTLALPTASYINVTGNFFVVVVQISSTVNLGLGYEPEPDIRRGNFYFRSPQGSTIPATSAWFDAAESTVPFTKFMVDVTMLNQPVPVKISSFTAYKEGKQNILNWQTASEVNSKSFDIERSKNGSEFVKIGFINSIGNSSSTSSYVFVDKEPINGLNYYRLRQIDKDGKEFMSEIVMVNNEIKKNIEIIKLFPNPVTSLATVVFTGNANSKVNINVTNMFGKVVQSKVVTLISGENRVELDTHSLAAGAYTITVADMNSENFATTRLIKL